MKYYIKKMLDVIFSGMVCGVAVSMGIFSIIRGIQVLKEVIEK